MYNCRFTQKQLDWIEKIEPHGAVILYNDSSKVFVCDERGNTLDVSIEMPFKMFEVFDFIGILRYEREIGRDQYFYKLRKIK